MEIKTIWQQGQYPSFNLELSSEAGKEPFLVIRGVKIVDGPRGPFISYPAKKNETTGKYWNHAVGSDKFNALVMNMALGEQQNAQRQAPARAPAPRQAPSHDAARARQTAPSSGFDDFDDQIPF